MKQKVNLFYNFLVYQPYFFVFQIQQCVTKYYFLETSDIQPLIEKNMEFEKVTVVDGSNGNTTEWITTSEVINSSSSSNNDINVCK